MGEAPVRWLASLLALALGCATPVVRDGDRLRAPERGWSVAHPGPAWERIRMEGAELAFARADGARLSLLRSCTRRDVPPQVLARQLLIGTGEREMLQSGPTTGGGLEGWSQSVQLRGGTHFRSVTLVADRCAFDLVLVAPTDTAADADAAFAAWWPTFVPVPAAGPDEGGE